MDKLIMAIFTLCVNQTIPNPHAVSNLTQEQQAVLSIYVRNKCQQVAQQDKCVDFYKKNKDIDYTCLN